MKLGKYLKEHWYWLVGLIILVVSIDIFLMTLKGSVYLMLYVTAALVLCFFACLYVDYLGLRKVFNGTRRMMDSMDKKYLVPEVMDKVGSQVEQQLRDILNDAEVSMCDNVAGYKRDLEEYKEYIETWVHEVKIPISTSKMIMENHREDTVGESDIDVEIDRIEGYVEQALFYSRSAEVEKDYFIKEVNIGEIVKTCISKRKKTLISMRASIDMHDLEPSKPVKSDGKWLSFIVGQVIDNSIKYAKEEEKLKLSVYLTEEEGKTCLHIEDNGCGIKQAELGRVFDKGFTGTNGRAGKASTGLGLYLCRKLCRRLEHDMEIRSEEGKGTDVIIILG